MSNPTDHPDWERESALFLEQYLSGCCDEENANAFLKLIEEDPSLFEAAYQNLVIDFLLKKTIGHDDMDGENDFSPPRTSSAFLPDFDHLADLVTLSPPLSKTAEEESTVATTTPKPQTIREKGSFLPLTVLLAMILCIFLPLIYLEWNPSDEDHARDVPLEKNKSIAVLTNYADVVWAEGTLTPSPGVPLSIGSLRFESGSIELLFFNGVRSVIEGPADLTLLGEKQVFCRYGTWSVTVPPQGTGFEIQTPSLVVRDIGTEFLAMIDANKSEVEVLKGLVEVENSKGPKTVLQTGQGALFRPNLPVEVGLAKLDRFISRLEMRRRSDVFLSRSKTSRTLSHAAPQEAKAIRKIDFSQIVQHDATAYGGDIIRGAEPGSKAFRFSGSTDRIRLRSVGELEAATFVLSLRVDRLDREVNPVLMTEDSTRGGLVWHILPDGQFIIGTRYQKAHKRGVFRTPVVLTPETIGRWITLAWTLRTSDGRFTVYVEGDPVYNGTLPYAPRLNLESLDIGSWKLKSGNSIKNHCLDGAVERFLLFDRVLTVEEIRALSRSPSKEEPKS